MTTFVQAMGKEKTATAAAAGTKFCAADERRRRKRVDAADADLVSCSLPALGLCNNHPQNRAASIAGHNNLVLVPGKLLEQQTYHENISARGRLELLLLFRGK